MQVTRKIKRQQMRILIKIEFKQGAVNPCSYGFGLKI